MNKGITRVNKTCMAALVLASTLLSFAANAEEEIFALKPLQIAEDPNGVDLLSGTYRPQLPVLSVPAAPSLRFENIQKFQPKLEWKITSEAGAYVARSVSVTYGRSTSDSFTCEEDNCTSAKGNGSTFTPTGTGGVYVQGHSGVKMSFNQVAYSSATQLTAYPSLVEYPSGETVTYAYDTAATENFTYHRPTVVSSSIGYELHFTYASTDIADSGWGRVTSAKIFKSDNLAAPVASYTYGYSGGTTTVTDALGRTWVYSGFANALGTSETSRNTSFTRYGRSSPSITVTSSTQSHEGVSHDNFVTSVVRDGMTFTYTYVTDSSLFDPYKGFKTVTVNGPENYSRTVTIGRLSNGQPYIKEDTNGLQQKTSYVYDTQMRITKVAFPENNLGSGIYDIEYTYDDRGNVTAIRRNHKSGAGAIIETANYPSASTCSGMKCFRPNSSTNGLGNITDYLYDATHGGLLSRTEPADANGVRRKTINEYTTNAIGLHRLRRTRVCSEGAVNTCGTATEQVTEYTYWGNTFQPLTVSRTNGAGATPAVTTYSYDDAGRVLSEDGPLPGTGDAVYTRYDAAGRPIWKIGAVNQSGVRVATRTVYNNTYDLPELVDTGTVAASVGDPVAFIVVSKTLDHDYNGDGLRTKTVLKGETGTVHSLEQYNYDGMNRAKCTARRMSLVERTDACDAGTKGSHGYDRVTLNYYDALSRIVQTVSGYDTPDAGIDIEIGYTNNGQIAWRRDGNGNQTDYTYDGYDRLQTTTYPDLSTETNTYDNNGNLLSFTKRDGQVLEHAYDAANRRTATTIVGAFTTHGDIAYDYDPLGRPQTTTQGASSITRTYDELGNVASVNHNGRTLNYDYDIAGRRTQLTWPDGYKVSYDYENDGALSAITEVNTGAMLVSYAYDGLGKTTDLFRGNGVSTNVVYDTASRVNTIDHIGLNATTFSWNPAGQIASRTVTNTVWHHAMPADGMVDDYTPNVLNQYTEIDGQPVTHDQNGNLTDYYGNQYTYNIHNRMTKAVIGSRTIVLAYDPDGRLSKSVVDGTATEFLYDGDELVAEYDNNGNLLRRYIHGAGVDDPQVVIEANGTKRWLHADERGSIVAETNAAGGVAATHTYDPYGNPGNTSVSRFRYTGQIMIPGTEANALYYYKARVYHPRIGRFMQTDPIGYKDGMNWYAYVGNDPVNGKDPSGKFVVVLLPFVPPAAAALADAALVVTAVILAADAIDHAANGMQNESANSDAGRPASVPTGSRGDPVEVEDGTNEPTEIEGRNYSGHAQDRMQGRGVPPSAVEEAISNGESKPGRDDKTIHTDRQNGVEVVTNKNGDVVTVKHTGRIDPNGL